MTAKNRFGDVGAGSDGQADVGLGEGGCVVDAVAHHADPAAFGLQAVDLLGLVFRQHLGEDPVDPDLLGDGFSGAAVVAGDHDQVEPELLQGGYRPGGVGLDGVGNGQDAGGSAVDGGQYGCLAFRGECGRDRV